MAACRGRGGINPSVLVLYYLCFKATAVCMVMADCSVAKLYVLKMSLLEGITSISIDSIFYGYIEYTIYGISDHTDKGTACILDQHKNRPFHFW